MSANSYDVHFLPMGLRGQCPEDKPLLYAARQVGAGILCVCGDRGTCRSCKVQVSQGTVTEPVAAESAVFSPEEMAQGWRLACQARPLSDCDVKVPVESMMTQRRVQVEGQEVDIPLEPAVTSYRLKLTPPALDDLRADADRLLAALSDRRGSPVDEIDLRVAQLLSPELREWKWQCRASVRGREVVAVGRPSSRCLGLAVDLGTTKIAGYLMYLRTGRTLAARGVMNPQAAYGADIISRINKALESASDAERLQSLIVGALNQLVVDMCREAGVKVRDVADAVIVGNTAMHHLLLRLPVRQLALAPFVPAIAGAMDVKARDLGLDIAPGAYVHLPPNIAGFVGGDHVAMLLATQVWRDDALMLALDIGTNTEISLVENGSISTVSCASGPAFEGGHIRFGMQAAPGAIERLRIEDDDVQYQTIGEIPALGLCGSGILDAVAQMYRAGVLDRGGRMMSQHSRVREQGAQREFVLVDGNGSGDGRPAVTMTQKDVREVQLAKAAVRAGIQMLLESRGKSVEDLDRVIIAGAFGSYIDVGSAVEIGMLPDLPLMRFTQVGNAAGMGAKLALLSSSKRDEAGEIARRARYVELSGSAAFAKAFTRACYLGRQ